MSNRIADVLVADLRSRNPYSERDSGQMILNPDGLFAGFKRPCHNCGEHFRTLSDDGWCDGCVRHSEKMVEGERTLRQLLCTAKAIANNCISVMTIAPHWAAAYGWSEEHVAYMAGEYARQTYQACLKHQLAGGQPWDGGE